MLYKIKGKQAVKVNQTKFKQENILEQHSDDKFSYHVFTIILKDFHRLLLKEERNH